LKRLSPPPLLNITPPLLPTRLKLLWKRLSNLDESLKPILIRIALQEYNSSRQLKHYPLKNTFLCWRLGICWDWRLQNKYYSVGHLTLLKSVQSALRFVYPMFGHLSRSCPFHYLYIFCQLFLHPDWKQAAKGDSNEKLQ